MANMLPFLRMAGMMAELDAEGFGGGSTGGRYPKSIKCPLCSSQQPYKPSDRLSTGGPQTKDLCSHNARVVYTKAHCPVCLDNQEPMVALSCGHLICCNDFKAIGGKMGEDSTLSPEETAEREREERRRQLREECARRMGNEDDEEDDDAVGPIPPGFIEAIMAAQGNGDTNFMEYFGGGTGAGGAMGHIPMDVFPRGLFGHGFDDDDDNMDDDDDDEDDEDDDDETDDEMPPLVSRRDINDDSRNVVHTLDSDDLRRNSNNVNRNVVDVPDIADDSDDDSDDLPPLVPRNQVVSSSDEDEDELRINSRPARLHRQTRSSDQRLRNNNIGGSSNNQSIRSNSNSNSNTNNDSNQNRSSSSSSNNNNNRSSNGINGNNRNGTRARVVVGGAAAFGNDDDSTDDDMPPLLPRDVQDDGSSDDDSIPELIPRQLDDSEGSSNEDTARRRRGGAPPAPHNATPATVVVTPHTTQVPAARGISSNNNNIRNRSNTGVAGDDSSSSGSSGIPELVARRQTDSDSDDSSEPPPLAPRRQDSSSDDDSVNIPALAQRRAGGTAAVASRGGGGGDSSDDSDDDMPALIPRHNVSSDRSGSESDVPDLLPRGHGLGNDSSSEDDDDEPLTRRSVAGSRSTATNRQQTPNRRNDRRSGISSVDDQLQNNRSPATASAHHRTATPTTASITAGRSRGRPSREERKLDIRRSTQNMRNRDLKRKLKNMRVDISHLGDDRAALVEAYVNEVVNRELRDEADHDTSARASNDPYATMPILVPAEDPPKHGMWILKPTNSNATQHHRNMELQYFFYDGNRGINFRSYGNTYATNSNVFPSLDGTAWIMTPPRSSQGSSHGARTLQLVTQSSFHVDMYDQIENTHWNSIRQGFSDCRNGVWALCTSSSSQQAMRELKLVCTNYRFPQSKVIVDRIPDNSRLVSNSEGGVWLFVSSSNTPSGVLAPGLWYITTSLKTHVVTSVWAGAFVANDCDGRGVWTMEHSSAGAMVLSHYDTNGAQRQQIIENVDINVVQGICNAGKNVDGVYITYKLRSNAWKIGVARIGSNQVSQKRGCPRNCTISSCGNGGVWIATTDENTMLAYYRSDSVDDQYAELSDRLPSGTKCAFM